MNNLIWEWAPLVSIGGLSFDKEISIERLPYQTEIVDRDKDIDNYASYKIIEDNTRFVIIGGCLISVEVESNIFYQGLNYIGQHVDKLISLLGNDFKIENHQEMGEEYSCDNLGIVIWTKKGIIESVSVSS